MILCAATNFLTRGNLFTYDPTGCDTPGGTGVGTTCGGNFNAKLVVTDHNTAKKTVVIATARDGYAVVFSWSELYNSPAGADVLVLFERDDKALPAAEGPLALISGRDIRTGPRHVKWLERIEVKQIVD